MPLSKLFGRKKRRDQPPLWATSLSYGQDYQNGHRVPDKPPDWFQAQVQQDVEEYRRARAEGREFRPRLNIRRDGRGEMRMAPRPGSRVEEAEEEGGDERAEAGEEDDGDEAGEARGAARSAGEEEEEEEDDDDDEGDEGNNVPPRRGGEEGDPPQDAPQRWSNRPLPTKQQYESLPFGIGRQLQAMNGPIPPLTRREMGPGFANGRYYNDPGPDRRELYPPADRGRGRGEPLQRPMNMGGQYNLPPLTKREIHRNDIKMGRTGPPAPGNAENQWPEPKGSWMQVRNRKTGKRTFGRRTGTPALLRVWPDA